MKFLLIENEYNEQAWYLLVEDSESQLCAVDTFNSALSQKFVNNIESSGLSFDMINDYTVRSYENISNWLNEGHTVISNRSGGVCFLTDNWIVLREINADKFPLDTELEGLSGWLDTKGKFYPCEYGEHHILAQSYNKPDKELLIPMGHSKYNTENSYVHIDTDTITPEQIDWFNKHEEKLDGHQIEILFKYNIIK